MKLVREGSLKRYLIYAIGEILLVMIGILLALQVSNWNRESILENKELKALKDLQKEFRLNKERIEHKQAQRVAIGPELDRYINLISTGKADHKTFKDFHSGQFLFGMTNPSNGVIEALISSGEIALISNDSLKYLLADWKNQAENLYENEQILWDSGLKYIDSSIRTMPDPRHDWEDWDEKRLKSAFNQLSNDLTYRNQLIGFKGANDIVIEECKTVLALLDHVLVLLDKEISKHQ